MNYRERADNLFLWASEQPRASIEWERHSKDVALVCEKIAEKAGMDVDLAYAKGLLHDIYKSIERDNEITVVINGKKTMAMTHPCNGYRLLLEKDFPEAARAALTHAFYDVYENGLGYDDRLTPEDVELLKEWLGKNEFDAYDKLVQLADNMASWKGIMTINDRFCDILLRHPVARPHDALVKLYELKDYFDEKTNGNIYELFKEEILETAITEPTRKNEFVA